MTDPVMPFQIRGARGLLNWSMMDLAAAAAVSVSSIKRLEVGEEALPTAKLCLAIRAALEAAGIRFIDDGEGGVGVLRRNPASHPERSTARLRKPDGADLPDPRAKARDPARPSTGLPATST